MLKRIKGVLTIMLATGRRDRKLFGDESSSASTSSSSATAADSVIHNRSEIPKNEDSAMNTSINTALGGNMMTCSSSSRQVSIPPARTTTTSSQIVTAHPLSPSPSSTNNHHRRHQLWTLISSSSSSSSSAAASKSAVFTCMSSTSAEVHIELIPETSDGLECSPPSTRMTSDNFDRGQHERAANDRHVMISNSSLEHYNNGAAGITTGRNLNYSSTTFASKKQKAYEVQTDRGGFISISSDDRSSDTLTSESTRTSSTLAMSEARSSSASSHHHGEGDSDELQLLGDEPASSYVISPWDMALNRRRNASHHEVHEGYYNAESASSHYYFCTQEEEEEAVELLTSGLKDLMKARDYLYTMMTSRAAHVVASRLNSSSKAGTIMSWTESSAGDTSEANNNAYNELDRRLESKGYVAASIHKYELAKSLLKEDLPKIRVARVYPDKMSDSQVRNALKKRSRLLRSLAEVEDMIQDYSTLVVQMMQRSAR